MTGWIVFLLIFASFAYGLYACLEPLDKPNLFSSSNDALKLFEGPADVDRPTGRALSADEQEWEREFFQTQMEKGGAILYAGEEVIPVPLKLTTQECVAQGKHVAGGNCPNCGG